MNQAILLMFMYYIRGKAEHAHNNLSDCDKAIKKLTSMSRGSDPLKVFGGWMKELVSALDRNRHRFRVFPKGPIGTL